MLSFGTVDGEHTAREKKNCFVGTVAKKSLSNIAAWDVFGDFAIYGILIFLGLVLFDCLLLFVCFFLLWDHIVHWHRLPRVSSLEIPRSCLDAGLGPSSGWPCWWSRDWSRGTQRVCHSSHPEILCPKGLPEKSADSRGAKRRQVKRNKNVWLPKDIKSSALLSMLIVH